MGYKVDEKSGGHDVRWIVQCDIKGNGKVAITSHYEPLTLLVRPGEPVHYGPECHCRLVWQFIARVPNGY